MAQDAQQEVAAEPPKTKKKLIIIIAAVALLAGGGGAAYFLMQPKEGDKKVEKKAEPAKVPVFLPLETFTVNLLPDPDEKFLQIEATVQVATPEVAEQLKVQMPAVRNRVLMLLTSKTAADISTPEGKRQLSEEMLDELKRPFVKGAEPQQVTDVLFTSFVVQ